MVKYFGTKRTKTLKRSGRAPITILYIPSDWNVDPTKYYNFTIRRLEGSATIYFTKKLTKVGKDAYRIIINAAYGIEPDEMIVFIMEEVTDEFEDPMETEYADDT